MYLFYMEGSSVHEKGKVSTCKVESREHVEMEENFVAISNFNCNKLHNVVLYIKD